MKESYRKVSQCTFKASEGKISLIRNKITIPGFVQQPILRPRAGSLNAVEMALVVAKQ